MLLSKKKMIKEIDLLIKDEEEAVKCYDKFMIGKPGGLLVQLDGINLIKQIEEIAKEEKMHIIKLKRLRKFIEKEMK